MQRGARIFEKTSLPCSVALVLRFAKCAPSTRGRARRDLCESAPMQRGAHFFLQKKRSHAAWRSKCWAPLRRPRSPVLRFPVFGASSFLSCCSFGALALCFPIVCGRPWPSFPSLEVLFVRFGALVLYFPLRGALLFSVWGVALGRLGLPFGSPGPVGPG